MISAHVMTLKHCKASSSSRMPVGMGAFGSIRMEPVFMVLGQSAAVIGSLALDKDLAVQEIEYDKIRNMLIELGQVLE